MTEHPSKLLLQTLDRASKILYGLEDVSAQPCTETRTPWEIKRSDPIWWNACAREWATADWALLLTDKDAFFEAYPHIREYHRLTGCLRANLGLPNVRKANGDYYGDQRDATWEDNVKGWTRWDEFQ